MNPPGIPLAPLPPSYRDFLGHKLLLFLRTVQGLGAFALITLGVLLQKINVASNVLRPRFRQEVARSGVALLPMFGCVALGRGFLVVGQTVAALAKVGAIRYLNQAAERMCFCRDDSAQLPRHRHCNRHGQEGAASLDSRRN